MKRAFIASALLILCGLATGCHHHARKSGGCANGQCGITGGAGACVDGSCQVAGAMPGDPSVQGAAANYSPNGGQGGHLGGMLGHHHRGPQSHTGPMPGPAMGPAAPTVGYPYYTTRGPRDFLSSNPPSIGR
jgi:hypothetical protein